MRAYVFTDRALQRHAGQFVWLSLDVEKAENAIYKKRYGVDALPMFFVLDPKTEKAALRWVGGATVPQLQKILADGLTVVRGKGRGVEEVLARADLSYMCPRPVLLEARGRSDAALLGERNRGRAHQDEWRWFLPRAPFRGPLFGCRSPGH